MKDENEFYLFICGKLLGDGCITKQTGRKPRFQFMHRVELWQDFANKQVYPLVN